jgi:hypothetical protein
MLFTPSISQKYKDQLFMLSHGKLSEVKWVTGHKHATSLFSLADDRALRHNFEDTKAAPARIESN